MQFFNNIEVLRQKSVGCLNLEVGQLFGKRATVLRDTGCTIIGCRKDLVPLENRTKQKYTLKLIDGDLRIYETAYVDLDTPYLSGRYLAALFEDPVADLIIGNLEQHEGARTHYGNVVTRAQEKKDMMGDPSMRTVIRTVPTWLEGLDLPTEQDRDPSLKVYWEKAKNNSVDKTKHGEISFEIRDKILYRLFKYNVGDRIDRKLVVPESCRQIVLDTAHESALAGHMSVRRTQYRIFSEFFWPNMSRDITRYVKTCPTCQKARPPGSNKPVELGQMEVIGEPFQKVAIDIVGPLQLSRNKNRYILTLIDVATRWPEAIPLKFVTTQDIHEALLTIFARMGFPEIILSDNGPQFSSDLYDKVCELFNIKIQRSSIYHPQSNGMVERFNGTLKQMLMKVSNEEPENWDRFLPAILFAYREVPNETTSFSPYELMFGRKVRGPMAILKTLMTKEGLTEENKISYQYVIDLKNRLQTGLATTQANVRVKTELNKRYYDRKTVSKDINVGDLVLVLKPKKGNKLTLHYEGPLEVTKKLSKFNIEVKKGRKHKVFHLNRITKFLDRGKDAILADRENNIRHGAGAAIIIEDTDEFNGDVKDMTLPTVDVDDHTQIDINKKLNDNQQESLRNLLQEFNQVISDIPGRTTVGSHKIELLDTRPIALKPYIIPLHMVDVLKEEVQKMLDLGIIEESKSSYSSPIIMVKKKDGSVRTCVDYRKLNAVTKTVVEVMPNTENLLSQLHGACYFSKLDLTKGYWQIPLDIQSKEYTAFQGPDGLYHYKYMPFGLTTAPATFNNIIKKLFAGITNVITYYDDICIYTEDWETHLLVLRKVFTILKDAGFTVKPSKLELAKNSVDFLGHTVDGGVLKPDKGNLDKILKLTPPRTKKQVRGLVGLISYYNKFIPNFSTLTAPLTDLTKKGKTNNISWTVECQLALEAIQKYLTNDPILVLPNYKEQFIVRTDASTKGLGACLLQNRNNLLHPVKYISRKLLDRETRYSTIERECLAIIWGIQKLAYYLMGARFILQCDHQALKYLKTSTFANSRITRWSLILQEFNFDVQYIKGPDNIIADFLSRQE